jgi:pyruvate dehydrogenase E2 component (dihydrolipoamide acetyltransferase)
MAEVILMPRLSDTMTEGIIAAWHKNVGDTVKKGDLLAEIETDKATMELESYKDGTLLHIGIDKGGKLQVNDVLAIIGKSGEDISSLLKDKSLAHDHLPADTINSNQLAEQPKVKEQETTIPDISKMEEVVLMPRLSDTMEEGVIASWNKNVGDTVKKGDVLAEIETDKATMELESYKNGTLLYVGAQKGEKIPVNALLCIIGEKGKVDVDAIVAAVKENAGHITQKDQTGQKSESIATTLPVTNNEQTSSGNGRVKASPLAKKIAKEKGVDLKMLHGSGDGGRIIKADIDTHIPSVQPVIEKQTMPAPAFTPVAGKEGYTDIPNSQIRNIIAKRLGESKFSAPHFYLTMEINMDNAISARTQLNEESPVKISFNDLVVKAVALSLRQHPAVNASWNGDKIRRWHHIHIGIAVAIEDGLIVPVVRFADQKSLPQIAAESKELSGKAKNKKLQPDEFAGNTFTVSNLGMMDIDEFTAIINPPDSCIMAVGKIKEVVVKKADGFGVSNVMKVTLSCDHRSVDGATGAAFLQTFKKYLESPVRMLV